MPSTEELQASHSNSEQSDIENYEAQKKLLAATAREFGLRTPEGKVLCQPGATEAEAQAAAHIYAALRHPNGRFVWMPELRSKKISTALQSAAPTPLGMWHIFWGVFLALAAFSILTSIVYTLTR